MNDDQQGGPPPDEPGRRPPAGRPDDQQAGQQGGLRNVFEGRHGYYVEPSPGAGPAHHDDLPVTPQSVEDKQAGPFAAPAPGPGADWSSLPGYLVITRDGHLQGAYPDTTEGYEEAYATTRAGRGHLVRLTSVADMRGWRD